MYNTYGVLPFCGREKEKKNPKIVFAKMIYLLVLVVRAFFFNFFLIILSFFKSKSKQHTYEQGTPPPPPLSYVMYVWFIVS